METPPAPLRLFLSVDMVGSTEFKARSSGASTAWVEIFRDFFTKFPLLLAGQVGFEFFDEEETPALEVWKALGDEAIFMAEPNSAEEITSFIAAMLRAIALYERDYFSELPLRLKGSAWLVDFSEGNIELPIPELSRSGSSAHVDFIGPDVDIGFRISSRARPQVIVMSADVVSSVLNANNRDKLDMFLLGREPFKGVIFGQPYPIVWARLSGETFNFFPWEIDTCPLMSKAMTMSPTPDAELRAAMDSIAHYLRKMHGIVRSLVRTARPRE